MSDKPDIFMPLYIGDYLAGTSRLTTLQHGAYLLLIMDYWMNGSLPDDDRVLANIARMTPEEWAASKRAVKGHFEVRDAMLFHARIEQELELATKRKIAKSKNGTKGAASKWGDSVSEGKLKRSERLASARRLARHSPGVWQALLGVLRHSCVKCGSTDDIVKDHIIPIYQGGSDGIDNLQPLCRKCNASKGSESIDYRPGDWRERLESAMLSIEAAGKAPGKAPGECLANAWPSPSPSPISLLKDFGDFVESPEKEVQGEQAKKPKKEAYTKSFEILWKELSSKWNGKPGNKNEAFEAFKKINPSQEELDQILAGHKAQYDAYLALRSKQDCQIWKHVCRYLKNEAWLDEPEQERETVKPKPALAVVAPSSRPPMSLEERMKL